MEESLFIKTQVERNQLTRGSWEMFADHRTHVHALLENEASGKTLCVLGAGNANDLDLVRISKQFHTVTLVDLDPEAVQGCLRRCLDRSPSIDNIEIVCPLDVTGVLRDLGDASVSANDDFQTLLERSRQVTLPDLATYDVVASTCLLSQLLDSVNYAVPADHPRNTELVLAVRDGHLQLLTQLTKPGGTSVLITDFVSSNTFPELATIADDAFPIAIHQQLMRRNFFTGINPVVLIHSLSPANNKFIESISVREPWRWQLGPRTFAVYAISATRNLN